MCAGRLYVTFSLRSRLCDAYVKNLNLLILVDSKQYNDRNSQKQPTKAFRENYFSENFGKFFEIDVGEWLYCNKQHQDFLHVGNFLKLLEILFKPSFWYVVSERPVIVKIFASTSFVTEKDEMQNWIYHSMFHSFTYLLKVNICILYTFNLKHFHTSTQFVKEEKMFYLNKYIVK